MNIFSSVTNAQYDHPGQKVPEYLALLQEALTLSEKVEVLEAEIRRLKSGLRSPTSNRTVSPLATQTIPPVIHWQPVKGWNGSVRLMMT